MQLPDVRFSVLGPLSVRVGGQPVAVPGPRQRHILALLLLNADIPVTNPELAAVLWNDDPPPTGRRQVQNAVSRLRQVLGQHGFAGLDRESGGYRLSPDPDGLDLIMFEALVADGQRAAARGDRGAAADSLHRAMGLWRGPALTDLTSDRIRTRAAHLDERLAAVAETYAGHMLACGQSERLADDLAGLVAQHPLRERLIAAHMLALYYGGRQAEALAIYHQTAAALADTLGVDPGPELTSTFERILRHDARPPSRPVLASPDGAGAGADDATPTTEAMTQLVAESLRTAPAPRQLPPDIGDFAGREEQQERLLHLLGPDGGMGFALCGRPGVGKTALAVHLAHRVASQFPDGQVFIDLHAMDPKPLEPAAALGQILLALGVESAALPDDIDVCTAMYRTVLTGRRMLILLDNAAGDAQVRPLLPGTNTVRVIITSRRPLTAFGPSLPSIPVELLTRFEALTLLAGASDRGQDTVHEPAAERIVELCGRLPLALRIAGARLASKRHWSLPHMAGRLTDRRSRLDELATGDLAVRTSISMTVDGLPEPDRLALWALGGLWSGDFSGWLAAAVLACPVAQAENVLERLVDAQLVEPAQPDPAGRPRYRLHDLIRDFAQDGFQQHPPEHRLASTRLALDACLSAVRHAATQVSGPDIRFPGGDTHGAGPGQPCCVHQEAVATTAAALAWFATERRVLTTAIQHGVELSLGAQAWRIAHACAVFYELRADWADWRNSHQSVLEALRGTDQLTGIAAMLCGLGQLGVDKGPTRPARRHLDDAVAASRQAGEPGLEAYALRARGNNLLLDGRRAAAVENFEAGLRLARRARDRTCEAACLHGLGSAHWDAGQYDEAVQVLTQAVEIVGKGADRRLEPYIHCLLGICHQQAGRPHASLPAFRRAIASARVIGDVRAELSSRRGLADAHRRVGQPAQSLALLRRVLATVRMLGDRVGEAQTLRRRGEALTDLGRTEEACRELALALEIVRSADLPGVEAEVRYALGLAHLRDGDRDCAAESLRTAAVLFDQCGARHRRADAQQRLRQI